MGSQRCLWLPALILSRGNDLRITRAYDIAFRVPPGIELPQNGLQSTQVGHIGASGSTLYCTSLHRSVDISRGVAVGLLRQALLHYAPGQLDRLPEDLRLHLEEASTYISGDRYRLFTPDAPPPPLQVFGSADLPPSFRSAVAGLPEVVGNVDVVVATLGDNVQTDIAEAMAAAEASGRHVLLVTDNTPLFHSLNVFEGYDVPLPTIDDLTALEDEMRRALPGAEGVYDLDARVDAIPLIAVRFGTSVTLIPRLFGVSERTVALTRALAQPQDRARLEAHTADLPMRRMAAFLDRQVTRIQQESARRAEQYETTARQLLAEYLNNVRNAEEQRRYADADAQHLRSINERNLNILRRMLDNGAIRNLSFHEDQIRFDTRRIYVRDARTGVWHHVGRFAVTINIRDGGHRFVNLDGYLGRSGFDHPHVRTGTPCLGSLAEAVPPILRSGEWALLAEMSLAYLEEANVEDGYGQYIHEWPVVMHPEAVGLPPHEGVATNDGLSVTPPPEGDGDFGAFGLNAFVRRDGVLYYYSGGYYRTIDGTPRHQVRRIMLRPNQVPADAFGPGDIVITGQGRETMVFEHDGERFVNADGWPLGDDPVYGFVERVAAELANRISEGELDASVGRAWRNLNGHQMRERYTRARGRTDRGVSQWLRDVRERGAA